MAETPSHRRRKGRDAFIPGDDPRDHCPYISGNWFADIYYDDFLDGWKEAEEEYNRLQQKDSEYCKCCGQKI